jgi:hypothetical protein
MQDEEIPYPVVLVVDEPVELIDERRIRLLSGYLT